ncbi:MAG: SDR family oxidoreductase [Bacteroidaceae bacterium]|nr:SDR family oxidoreductase [Bacteroidaceae bacterium]
MELLKGKKGLITGVLNDKSIAWAVARTAVNEGAGIVMTNTPVAVRLGQTKELARQLDCPLIEADATSIDDLDRLVSETMDHFGGKFDFVLHSIGTSVNIRKHHPYNDIDYSLMDKTLDISALSFHKLLQTLYKKDALNEWGSVVALTYIAADRAVSGYNDMADAKALLQSITRNFGVIYGSEKHVRINTVSQSPTATTAGSGIDGMDKMLEWADKVSPLGNASAQDCANYVCTLFSDLTRMVTMQNLYHDGGFSTTAVPPSPIG